MTRKPLSPGQLAQLMVSGGKRGKELGEADLDGDGKFTARDLLLHTLEESGEWIRGKSRPAPPRIAAKNIKPGETIRVSPLDDEDATLVLGVGTSTWRLERIDAGESEWTYTVPEIPLKKGAMRATLSVLRDRMLSKPWPIAIGSIEERRLPKIKTSPRARDSRGASS